MEKKNILTRITLIILCAITSVLVFPNLGQAQSKEGNLFIIGGGTRSNQLIKEMITTADLSPDDHIVILPMASKKPDKGIDDIKSQLESQSKNKIVGLKFDKKSTNKKAWLKKLSTARLVYIVGGSQRRFMNVVRNTPVEKAIHQAFENGGTIAGTSAGAAVMSKVMITGRALQKKRYKGFKRIIYDNIETVSGLGLLPEHNIIDQHFIKRSRQNRLFSILADFPDYMCIGIDESTAIVTTGKNAKVVGEGQVTIMADPVDLSKTSDGLVKFKNMRLSILTAGDAFKLK